MGRIIKDRNQIIRALEMIVGEGKNPVAVSKIMKIPYSGICRWMSVYWFYKNPINPVTITLKSKV
jgi:hypothetical protein